jgi:archaellum component FlaG (FlaF/FlaG flagellin family)
MDFVIALVIGATVVGALALQTVVSVVEALAKRGERPSNF